MKACVFTLGCKVNQYESDSLVFELEKRGYIVTTNLENADIYIINTCAVTNEAEKKSRQAISRVKKINSDASIIVTGCASQKEAKQFSDISGVTYVSGVKNKLLLIDNLTKKIIQIQPLDNFYDELYMPKPSTTRAYLKIQDGCNNFCSYCIIPYLRGRSRSRDVNDIVNEAIRLSKTAKELVITGINITDYKVDGVKALGKLLLELDKIGVRLRLGSIEINLIDDDFLKVVKKTKNLCPHFHLSLQSGSDTVLKRMNRHYTKEQFLDAVNRLRNIVPNASITTDIIVGFPDETDAEFLETYNFIRRVQFSQMHIFPYSKRSGTAAEKMNDLSGIIKKERVKRLEKLNNKLKTQYINSLKNIDLEILIEENNNDFSFGHSQFYVKCYLEGKFEKNSIVKALVYKPFKDGVFCRIK